MFNNEIESIRKAFPHTTPIMITYIIMGAVFGVMMVSNGYSPLISLLMACIIYAGAMQFVSVSLLSGSVPLTSIIILSLSINARQFFYAIASLRRYGYREGSAFPSWKRYYLMFSVTDETFAIFTTAPEERAKLPYIAGLIILTYSSWISGAVIGVIANSILPGWVAAGLGIALYALFIALVVPGCKSNHKIAVMVIMTALFNCLLSLFIDGSWAIVISTLLWAAIGACLIKPSNKVRAKSLQNNNDLKAESK